MNAPTERPEVTEFRNLIEPKLDVIEGRLPIFCIAAEGPNGGMPSGSEIAVAINTTKDLQEAAEALRSLPDPPDGALAAGNDTEQIGVSVFDAISAALLLASQVDSGSISPAVAEPAYIDKVLTPCDDLPDEIETLRETLDVLH